MIKVSGSSPRLFVLGEPVELRNVPWTSRNDGWDWRGPENLAYWLDLSFQAWDVREGWDGITAEAIFPRTGFAQFPRNLGSSAVRASGTCHTCGDWGGAGTRWELHVETRVVANNVIGDNDIATRGFVGDSTATLEGIDAWAAEGPVMAVLPTWGRGSYVGVGQMLAGADNITVVFNEEGVVHEPC